MECLVDLKRNLKKHGLDLLIKQGKPEDILPSLAKEYCAHTVMILIFFTVFVHLFPASAS